MRNLKRALSLVMAAAMLIGMMAVSASAADNYDDFTDKDEIVNTEAVATMVSLGVFNGKEDGSYFDPTGIVTRAEMAKIIAVSLNGGKDPVLGSGASTTQFSDTSGHWAEAYIAYCANLGIINGKGDGTFGPNEQVTGTAAAKMVLTALGYRGDIEGLTGAGWDLNTDTLANKIGLYDGLDHITPSNGLTRDDTAQLIYNGVQAYEVEYRNNYGEYSGVIYAQENGTMLANRFGVVKVTGVVVANDVMSIDADDNDNAVGTAKEGWTRLDINAVSGYSYSNYTSLYGKQQYKVVTSNDMVGQEVVIYVKYNNTLSPNASASTVLGQAIATDKNTVVETCKKLANASKVKDALKGSGLSIGGVSILFDETGRTDTATATGIASTAGLKQRFIDNDNDGVVNYVIQEAPALTKVKNVNNNAETITLEGLGSYDFEDVVVDEMPVKDDYMLVVIYDTKAVLTAAESVEGEITAWDSGNNKISIDGSAYGKGFGNDLTNSGSAIGSGSVGDSYALYLDAYGNYLGYKTLDVAVSNLALVLNSGISVGTLGSYSGQVKVLLADGTKATYNVDMVASAKELGAATTTGYNSTDAKKEAWTAEELSSGNAVAATDYNSQGVTDSTAKDGLKGTIVAVNLDDDGVATIGKPSVMNTKYTVGDVAVNTVFSKLTASFGGGMADSSTVFFVGNDTDGYSVLTGINSLSSTEKATSAAGSAVNYKSTSTSTAVAKAVYLPTDTSYATSATYAYIIGDYVEVGNNEVTYAVVFEDGTSGTLKSTDANQKANTVVKYEMNSKGNAEFKNDTDNRIFNGVVITYAGAPTISSVSGLNGDDTVVSAVMGDSIQIWNVEDEDDIYAEDTLSKDMSVCYVLDKDGYVKTAFVMDSNAGFATVSGISADHNKVAAGYKVTFSNLTAGTEYTYTYTVGSSTFTGTFTAKADGTGSFTMPANTTNGVSVTNPAATTSAT